MCMQLVCSTRYYVPPPRVSARCRPSITCTDSRAANLRNILHCSPKTYTSTAHQPQASTQESNLLLTCASAAGFWRGCWLVRRGSPPPAQSIMLGVLLARPRWTTSRRRMACTGARARTLPHPAAASRSCQRPAVRCTCPSRMSPTRPSPTRLTTSAWASRRCWAPSGTCWATRS